VVQDDKYTYPNSGGVLRNKRGLTDARLLDQAMNDLASAVWAAMSTAPVPAILDFSYLQRIHSLMFSRLFDWSGQVRDVDTVAGTTVIRSASTGTSMTAASQMNGSAACGRWPHN